MTAAGLFLRSPAPKCVRNAGVSVGKRERSLTLFVDNILLVDVPAPAVAVDPGSDALLAYYALDGDTLDGCDC